MRLTWKLFLAHARQQKVRLTLTALAMIAAIGVVLWVVSAYEVIASRFDEQTDDFVGDYSMFVVPQQSDDVLSEELIAAIEAEPGVETTNAVTQFRMRFRRSGPPPEENANRPGGRRRGMGPMGPSIVGTMASEPRYPLVDGRWLQGEDEAVVSSGIADAMSLQLGDSIEFQGEGGEKPRLNVVGITEQVKDVEFAMTRTKGGAPGGTNQGPASLAAYVPMSFVQTLTGKPPEINLVELRLKKGAQTKQLESTIAGASSEAKLLRPEDVREKLATSFAAEGARKQAYFVTALSILASAFIIFTTLSMGVNERARQLAILRAVGLRRMQVALLVLMEALILAMFGWLGGIAAGWALLKLLATASPQMFPNGVSFGGMSLALTAGCSLVGAVLASIFPIWKATSISPLEAMAPLQTRPRSLRWYAVAGLVSLLLISINPVLVYFPGMPESLRFILVLGVGAPATVIGFVLLAPLIVLGVEKIFSPLVAGMLRLQTNLVQTQLSANMWRSAGIAASLMLGLGLYTATQVWGRSMLGGFLPGKWTPDVIVKFEPGLPPDAVEKVKQTPGVRADSVLPIAVEQVRLLGDPLRSSERDSAVRQKSATLVGLDAKEAFEGSPSPFQLEFVQGDRDEALKKLKSGRHILVPDTFLTYAGLGVGDRLGLIPPKDPENPVEYEIVGVIATPGSNWMSKTSGMRRGAIRTAGLLFAPESQVREDFDLMQMEFFWLDVEPGVTAESLQEKLQPLALAPPESARRGRSDRFASRFEQESLKVTALSDVRSSLMRRGGAAINAMGWLPLITLLVLSLGIVNTISVSVRARRWEFGILRSVGLRRFGLTRLVLSEALMIGLVASVLSFLFGILVGWTCLGLVGYVSNAWFEGVTTPLVIPWDWLVFGYALTFILCVLAALWPAISSGRTEPLKLLQAGRAVT